MKARLTTLKRTIQGLPSVLSGIPATSEQRMTGRALQARRLKLWTKAAGCCALCGKLCQWPAGFALDHIVALVNGGEDSEANCQVLCLEPEGGCHAMKTAQDMEQARDASRSENGSHPP